MQQLHLHRTFSTNSNSHSHQFIINLSGSPHQTLHQILPNLNCVCGLKKQIQIIVSACLLKIDKLRQERNKYKQLYKQQRVKVQRLKESLDDWEKNYYQMRQVAIKKWDSIPIDENKILCKNLELHNTVKQLNIKLNKEKTKNRLTTESQNLDMYLNDLKYSNTRVLREDDSFLLECQKGVLSPVKIDSNLVTKETIR